MSSISLLPSNESEIAKAIDIANSKRLDLIGDELSIVKHLANPLFCPLEFLPFLAYAFKVDFWDEELKESEKRDLIKHSILLHQRKGTLWAIEEVLELVNYSNKAKGEYAKIKEGLRLDSRDGSYKYDGIYNHGSNDDWAKYVIYVPKPITISRANIARKLIEAYAPKRSHLVAIVYDIAASRDGTYFYNNEITHGKIGAANG
ncbi:MAG: phage tail protein I [Arcobacter sp.]|nr:MAG: phage tail protein I [Arcobacter sp.]